ncbi:hypothetical protein DdX_17894 [Ditylenchus destructor]|uniref:Uncharacterized protein n=1 Tax=Ditylenchus destructor TaxID=166010 RepID=A0AAD4MR44_9BILA|nr:hypothetical protein DdX_17894 [Ditylenchus destructor]
MTKGIIRNIVSDSLPVLIGTIPVQSKGPFKDEKVPFQDCLEPPTPSAPQPDTPPGSMPTFLIGPPPSYAESVFGCGKLKDEENKEEKSENEYTPRYIFYPKLINGLIQILISE